MLAPIFTEEDVAAADMEIERARAEARAQPDRAASGHVIRFPRPPAEAVLESGLEDALEEALEKALGEGVSQDSLAVFLDEALQEPLEPAPAAEPARRAADAGRKRKRALRAPWHAGWMAASAVALADMAGAGTWAFALAPVLAFAALAALRRTGRASAAAVAAAGGGCAFAALVLAWNALPGHALMAGAPVAAAAAARMAGKVRDAGRDLPRTEPFL